MNRSFSARIIYNTRVAEGYNLLETEPNSEIYPPIPGQFCLLRIPELIDPLLGRPICIFDYVDDRLKFLIRIRGKGTRLLTQLRKDYELTIIGPIGNGFPNIDKPERSIIIAGGIGLASVYMLAKNNRVRALFYGAMNMRHLLFGYELRDFCDTLYTSTNDGSIGIKGNIIDIATGYIGDNSTSDFDIYVCGPHGMYEAMAKSRIFNELVGRIYISVEERMACGVGSCLGCMVGTKDGYQRVCKEGPVFELFDIYERLRQ